MFDIVGILAVAYVPEHGVVLAFQAVGEIVARGGVGVQVVGAAVGGRLEQVSSRVCGHNAGCFRGDERSSRDVLEASG